jgi:hypothetical protein
MDKQELINSLISDDLNTLYECSDSSIRSVLEWGFKGYQNMTEEELIKELNEREIYAS